MSEKGWICLYRDITDHWLWNDAVKLKWWLDILLSVNHKDKKVLIGNKLIECNRGQSVLSLSNWAKRWSVSKHTVNNFFTLLKNDNMITTENLIKTIRITVCKYDTYQDVSNASGTDGERSGNASGTDWETNNNDNNDNNEEQCISPKEKTWREDFDVYMKEVTKAYDELVSDVEFLRERERYHPNLDIRLSLEKSFKDFWGTEAGWKNKKKSRSKTLDWKSTFGNALSQKMNQVYKGKDDLFSHQAIIPNQTKPQGRLLQ